MLSQEKARGDSSWMPEMNYGLFTSEKVGVGSNIFRPARPQAFRRLCQLLKLVQLFFWKRWNMFQHFLKSWSNSLSLLFPPLFTLKKGCIQQSLKKMHARDIQDHPDVIDLRHTDTHTWHPLASSNLVPRRKECFHCIFLAEAWICCQPKAKST